MDIGIIRPTHQTTKGFATKSNDKLTLSLFIPQFFKKLNQR